MLNFVLLTIERLYLILLSPLILSNLYQKSVKILNGNLFGSEWVFFYQKNSTLVVIAFPKQNVYLIDESHRLSK